MEKNRRGRRPKVISSIVKVDHVQNDTPIIAHLPIDLSEVINEQVDEIFIKQDNSNDNELKHLKKKIEDLTIKLNKYEKNLKPSVIPCENNSNNSNHFKHKCWWDRNVFSTPAVEMPDSYYNNRFNCVGKFCSWECMMAYNIDINDENIAKRTSLIYLMYKKTYNCIKQIKYAPSWKVLVDYGGVILIDEFRDNLTFNQMDYNYIKPPLVSRISYVEKIPIKNEVEDNIKSDDLILKRQKPLKSSKYSLESIMGLKKITASN
jgi:hypothetical protein